jgi:hypothetical protein
MELASVRVRVHIRLPGTDFEFRKPRFVDVTLWDVETRDMIHSRVFWVLTFRYYEILSRALYSTQLARELLVLPV